MSLALVTPSGSLTSSQVSAALGYTPANKAGDTFTGNVLMQGPRPWADLVAHGGDPTGVAASDTALDAAVAALPATGGLIYVPAGIFKLAATHTFTKEISFLGVGTSGSDLDNEALSTRALSMFLWAGGAADILVYNHATRQLGGISISNIAIDGAGTAARGLVLDRLRMSTVDNVRIVRCVTNCLWAGSTSATPNDNFHMNELSSVHLEGRNTTCVPLKLAGGPGNLSNACHSSFNRVTIDYGGDCGIDVEDADNCYFTQTFTYRRAGTGYAMRLRDRARSNFFFNFEGSVYAHANISTDSANQGGNVIVGYDRENGQVAPILEAGAKLMWTEDGLNAANGWVIPLLGGRINVKAFGAVGDGVNDNSDAIDKALRALPARGGTLYFPQGEYVISRPIRLFAVSSSVFQSVTLEGDGYSWDTNDATNAPWDPATLIRYSGAMPAQGQRAPIIQLGAQPAWDGPQLRGSTTGGTLAAATYYYRVLAYNAAGTLIDHTGEASVITTGATSSVLLGNYIVAGAASYRVYRGTTTGAQNVYYTTSAVTYTDTGAAGTSQAIPALAVPLGGVQIKNLSLDGASTASDGILADRMQFSKIERVGVRLLNQRGAYPHGTNNTSPGIGNPGVAPTLVASGTDGMLPAGTYYVKYAWRGVDSGRSLPSPASAWVTITAGQKISVTWTVHPSGGDGSLYLSETNGTPESVQLCVDLVTGTTLDITARPDRSAGLTMHTTGSQQDDCRENSVDQFAVRSAPVGIRLQGNIAHSANAAHNEFRRCLLIYLGDGLLIDDADNNSFYDLFCGREGQIGAGYAVVLGTWARAHWFYHLEPGSSNSGGVYAGVPNNALQDNAIVGYDRDNGQPAPTPVTYAVAPVLTPSTTGGTLAAATYYYKIESFDATGRLLKRSLQQSAVTTGATSSVAITVYSVVGAVTYRIWRGTATNTQTGYYETALTSFTDTGAAFTASGTLPTFNPAKLSWQEGGINGSGWTVGTTLRVAGANNEGSFSAMIVGPGDTSDTVALNMRGAASTIAGSALYGTPRNTTTFINRPTGAVIDFMYNATGPQWRMETTGKWNGLAGSYIGLVGVAGSPGALVAGDHWYDSTQKSHRFHSTAAAAGLVGLLYTNTADDALGSGGTAELKFASQIALAAAGLTVGKVVRVRLRGTVTTDATASQTAVINIKLGDAANATSGTIVATTRLALTSNLTNANWYAEADIVIRSATTAWGSGFASVGSTVAAPWTAVPAHVSNGGGVGTVTTIPNISTVHTVHATGTPNDTNMTITLRTMTVEILN